MLEEEGGEEGEVVDTHSESSFEQQQVFNVYLDDKSHEKNNETFYTFKCRSLINQPINSFISLFLDNFEPDSMDKSRGSLDNLRGEKDGISLGFPNSSTVSIFPFSLFICFYFKANLAFVILHLYAFA